MWNVTEPPAIWAGVAMIRMHLSTSAVSAVVMATADLTSNDVSERLKVTGSVPLQAVVPVGGACTSTVRLTSLTVVFEYMSSSWERTHLTSTGAPVSVLENIMLEIGAVVVAVAVWLHMR